MLPGCWQCVEASTTTDGYKTTVLTRQLAVFQMRINSPQGPCTFYSVLSSCFFVCTLCSLFVLSKIENTYWPWVGTSSTCSSCPIPLMIPTQQHVTPGCQRCHIKISVSRWLSSINLIHSFVLQRYYSECVSLNSRNILRQLYRSPYLRPAPAHITPVQSMQSLADCTELATQ